MDQRAAHLITTLGLEPHPEGGWFREVYRSPEGVQPLDTRSRRASLTSIYFLLTDADVSRWHRVASAEVWHFCEGAPLELLTMDAHLERVTSRLLGPAEEGRSPMHVVPPHEWQAARSTGAYTLVGCTVAPGFEFDDFRMLRDDHERAEAVRRLDPERAGFI